MKKIKITKEQYNKIAKYLTESVKIPTVPDMGKRVVNSFAQAGVKIKESSEIESDSKEKTLEKQTIDFINYLYNKDENLPSYDEICKKLVSKGIVINVDGKFRLSKSLGSAEQAKQALENELRNMLGGEKEEIEEGDWFDSHPDHPANQSDPVYTKASVDTNKLLFNTLILLKDEDLAILKDNKDKLYLLNLFDLSDKEKNDISDELGFTEKELVGRDEDGPDYDYYYNWKNNEYEEKAIIAAYAQSLDAGEGLKDFDNNYNLVTIDEPLKNQLIDVFSQNTELVSTLSSNSDEQPLNELHGEDEATFIQRKMKDHGLSYDMAKALYDKQKTSRDLDDKRFKQRDLQNAINSKKAEDAAEKAAEIERLKSKIVSKPEPKKPIGQYNIFGGVDEMALGGAGAMGGTNTNTAGNYQYGVPLGYSKKKLEETTQGEGSIGTYDANALSIGRNGEFNKGEQPRAFKEPQWAGGTFPQQPECSKPNNNKEAQNGGCNSGASSLKLKKVKGSVNAPSLGENKIYETIAKKTGKTIDEVKRIIESKKNKG